MKEILTVTRLNLNIKNILESSFGFVWVEGEISNLRRPQSGHSYFTLKDENSQIRAVVFQSPLGTRGNAAAFDFEEGMSIICRARLNVYHPRGEYQLIIDTIEPKGVGALQKAFEQLKERLQREGLFDEKHKKKIPFLPHWIGVITSPTGAVIRDILSVTGRRFPSVHILIAPVRVQGPEAPAEIIQAMADMNRMKNVDVIILARGGGSLEDLAPFNDEGVARSIYESSIPVISAVGHETDYTIADFVADLRTPTPSAAAEMAVPVKRELMEMIEAYNLRIIQYHRRAMEKRLERISTMEDRLRDPLENINTLRLFMDDRLDRLKRILTNQEVDLRNIINEMGLRIKHLSPLFQIKTDRLKIENDQKGLTASVKAAMSDLRTRVNNDTSMLDTLSPMAILRRGYSITKTLPAGMIVTSVDAVTAGGDIAVKVSDGSFQARVTKVGQE